MIGSLAGGADTFVATFERAASGPLMRQEKGVGRDLEMKDGAALGSPGDEDTTGLFGADLGAVYVIGSTSGLFGSPFNFTSGFVAEVTLPNGGANGGIQFPGGGTVGGPGGSTFVLDAGFTDDTVFLAVNSDAPLLPGVNGANPGGFTGFVTEIDRTNFTPGDGSWIGDGEHNQFVGRFVGLAPGFVSVPPRISPPRIPFAVLGTQFLPNSFDNPQGFFSGTNFDDAILLDGINVGAANRVSSSEIEVVGTDEDGKVTFIHITCGAFPIPPCISVVGDDEGQFEIFLPQDADHDARFGTALTGLSMAGQDPVNPVQDRFGGGANDIFAALVEQPTVRALVNATFTGPVSANTLVTAFGTKIGPKNFVFSGVTPEGTLQDNVEGVEVLVPREDGTVLNAKVLNASFFQTTFLMPIGLQVGEKVLIQIVCGNLKSSPLEVTIDDPDVAWWSNLDGTGIVQKIDPVTAAFSLVGPGNALGPGGIGVAWGQYGGETVPPCPEDGAVVNPTGEPFHRLENRQFEFSLLTGMDEGGFLTFETIFDTDPISFGTGPGQLCPVVQGAFIGPPEEVLLGDTAIEAIYKSWLLQNDFGMTAGEIIEMARQNTRDNVCVAEEERKLPVISEEDLRKAIELFNDDTVFNEKTIGLVSERFGILEPLPPARGTYFFDEFESFR